MDGTVKEAVEQLREKVLTRLDEAMEKTKANEELLTKLGGTVTTHDAVLAELEAGRKQLQESFERYTRQLPRFGQDRSGRDPDYGGFWPNERMAEDFGHLLLGLLHPASETRRASAEHVANGGYTLRRRDGSFAKGEDFVKAMGESTDAAGGYLVPDEFVSVLIRNVSLYGVFRRYARVVPMSRERQTWPKRTGGFTVYYPEEGVAPTASDLAFGTVTLTAKKWAVLTIFSRELEEDAVIGLGELIATEMALALAQAEDTNGFMGDGTSTYAGIVGVLKSPNVTAVTMGSGDTEFTDIAHDDLVDLVYSVPDWVRAMPDCAYYASPGVVGIIQKLKGTDGHPLYNQPTEGFPMRVNGFEVRDSNVLPGVADSGASTEFIAFGSLRAWGLLGQRRAFSIERSEEVKWLEDQIAIKAVPRQDIQEADGGAMAVLKTAAS